MEPVSYSKLFIYEFKKPKETRQTPLNSKGEKIVYLKINRVKDK